MKNFKLNVMEQMLNCDRVYNNLEMSKTLRLPMDALAGDPKHQKLSRDYFVKQFDEDTKNFVVSERVIDKVFPSGCDDMDRDIFYKKKVAREYLALPFDSIWIEGEILNNDSGKTAPLLMVHTKDNKYYLIQGVLIQERDNSYYISCLMTNELESEEQFVLGNGVELIHYSCIMGHDKIESGEFDTPEEEEFYCQMHILLELVTKHKKLGYIHYNQGSKIMTPKGVRKVHVNRVVGVCLKEEGVKIINHLNSKYIEFSHQFPCMAHWRYYPNNPEFEGKDQKGNRNQFGRTWVSSSVKGKDKKKKKGQIRYVNQYERQYGKMPPSEVA